MTTKVEKIVKTYKSLAQIPTLVAANIRSNGIINTRWSQRNLERGKSTQFVKDIFATDLAKSVDTIPLDVSSELLSRISASEKFRAVLRENDSKQYLEIWQENNNLRTVDLNSADVHGSVYTDGEFSAFEWSSNEKKLLYVAERKLSKSEPFYKRKGPSNDSTNADEEKAKGEEYLFEQDWGEQLVGKKKSVLIEYDIESDTLEVLKGIPDSVSIAQPKYSPDGKYIVGVAYELEPRKLGLIYCSNRSSTLFKLEAGNFLKVSLNGVAVKSPIFSLDGQSLLWLQRAAGGPHAGGMALVKTHLPLTESSTAQIVVDIVDTEIKIKNKRKFYGLYNNGFIKRPWASGNRILLNTSQKYTVNSYVVNIDNGSITELEFEDGSQQIVDVFNDTVLAVQRNFFTQDRVVVGKLPAAGSENAISWKEVTSTRPISGLENYVYKYLDLSTKDEEGDSVRSFNAIYVGPNSGNEKSIPLVVWPHGGPHSAFANNFILEASIFLSFGFAVILVNYRGSIGSGQKSVEFILGKIGKSDVADCILATDKALESFPWLNPNSIALVGGSHGGFLVAHLSGQYPDKFKAVVARNPVIDVASMSIISDIPDWCYVEAGREYTQRGEINNEILLAMRNASPIVHAHKVKAPTLLQIGSKDLRVPPHQGTEYHLRLKANGVVTKMNLYDDNHPLSSVSNEIDNIINTLLWIKEHLGIEH